MSRMLQVEEAKVFKGVKLKVKASCPSTNHATPPPTHTKKKLLGQVFHFLRHNPLLLKSITKKIHILSLRKG